MKNKSKTLALLLACFLVLAACSNPTNNTPAAPEKSAESSEPADPFGRYEEPVQISISIEIDPTDNELPPGDTPLDNQYTRQIKEALNVDVDHQFAASGQNLRQRISLAIASNDLPDAMVVNAVELRQLVEADQIADLTEVYEQYASPDIKTIIENTNGAALDAVTFDGKIMALPGVQANADGIHLLWIRQDWLDKLNLEPPTTMAELEEVARAFVENDPDGNGQRDTIGITGPESGGKLYANFLESKNNLYGFDAIFSAHDSFPGYWLEGEDGSPVYGSILPETREALASLRDLYSKGLIDPEMGVRNKADEPIIAGKSGMFFAPWWMAYGPLTNAVKNDAEANWQAYALPLNQNGEFRPHAATPSTEFVVVRKDYEHPEVPMKLLNNLFKNEQENTFDPSKGGPGYYPLRVVYAPSDEIEFTVKALRDVLAGNKTAEDFANDKAYKLLPSDIASIKTIKNEPYDSMDLSTWNPEANWGAWTRSYSIMVGGRPLVDTEFEEVPSLLYEQTPLMESRWVNLRKLEDETFLRIIMGAAPLETFDSFVENWKRQGGDQITQEVKDALAQ
ncbi:extracellular solute-binding protein [Paenibacillus sp. FSL H8-0457]|uniref:extracellular solute-binding protein n=1 Tax=Bacillales TaxID=1385 RepID=UPI0001789FC9|nr:MULTISPECIES: extracellular solute-binding protein [Paenibacillus]ACX65588.1 extracellular solute-binding protein family 1 [Paenibacillus sp. Y412MC10]ETT66828.1 family 1 extracellular solute-binding protein [Paenibacillus sp. FSL H8-457]MCM3258056.1 extracellular solute-binding protein [Paenibacillus lautus]MEC0204573.1 extracellular solute-binding protein [Paenibacillus lautus]